MMHQMCGFLILVVAGGLPVAMPAFLNSYSKIFMHFHDRRNLDGVLNFTARIVR